MTTAEDTRRVLVVDDEPNIADVVAMALRFQGFTVETAHRAHAALGAVTSFKPDLIVLDVMLPDIDGFEVANRLGGPRGRVPVIFLTARDATEDKIRGLSIGGDDYVTKPFSLEELVARVRTILRRAGPQRAGVQPADVRGPRARRGRARGHARRRAGRADRHRVPPAALPDAQPAPRAHARAAARARLGLRLRRRRAGAGDLRQLPAQEARRPRAAADPHRPRRRLRAADAARHDGLAAGPAAGDPAARSRRSGSSRWPRSPTSSSVRTCCERVDDQVRDARGPIQGYLAEQGVGPDRDDERGASRAAARTATARRRRSACRRAPTASGATPPARCSATAPSATTRRRPPSPTCPANLAAGPHHHRRRRRRRLPPARRRASRSAAA